MMSALTAPHGSIGAASIVEVQWKVDVLMTSLNEVEQVAVPVAVVGIRLSNEIVLTYTLSPDELHQWRFALAKGMRDVLYLQAKQPPHMVKKTRQ
jgi:hypothetical protein